MTLKLKTSNVFSSKELCRKHDTCFERKSHTQQSCVYAVTVRQPYARNLLTRPGTTQVKEVTPPFYRNVFPTAGKSYNMAYS